MIRERIFPEWHLHTQATSRWSTVHPNLAQLPPDLRDLYIPDPGTVWFGWDWDQQELRIFAAEARDHKLAAAFQAGHDVHTINACEIFGLPHPPNLVDPHGGLDAATWRESCRWEGKEDARRVFAKRFVYRLMYGGDPAGAGSIPGARATGMDGQELVAASKRWVFLHPAVGQFQQRIRQLLANAGDIPRTIRAWDGRRRVLLKAGGTKGADNEAWRAAVDYPMQGGAAGVAEQVYADIDDLCGEDTTFVYQMHDSAWWEFEPATLRRYYDQLVRLVEAPRRINGMDVPFPAAFKVMLEDATVVKGATWLSGTS